MFRPFPAILRLVPWCALSAFLLCAPPDNPVNDIDNSDVTWNRHLLPVPRVS